MTEPRIIKTELLVNGEWVDVTNWKCIEQTDEYSIWRKA